MFTRTTGLLIVPLWLAAMSWLVAHDVWPGVSAKEPPLLQVTDWLKTEGRQSEFTIFDDSGKMGTIWTTYLIDGTSILRHDIIWIERLPFPVCPLRTSIDSTFSLAGELDDFRLTLRNAETRLMLHGERFPSDFSFEFEMGLGEPAKLFKLPLHDGGTIAASFSPFSQLSDLKVGQRWRMQVFNPLAALTGLGERFLPMLVEVTGEEDIVTGQGVLRCLVVEASNTKAWVDSNGAVQVQELTMPLVGKIRIIRESGFDEAGRRSVQRWVPSRQGGRQP